VRIRRFLRNRALRLSRRVASPVQRWRAQRLATTMPLEPVRRRLELTLAAMYGQPMRIAAAGAAAEGDVVLPPRLAMHGDPDEALARFRLLALAQASRLARGTGAPAMDAVTHDLFLVAESAAAERDVVARAPKLATLLQALRFGELSARPKIYRLGAVERQVESYLRAVLATPPVQAPDVVPACASPAESLAWAQATADDIRRTFGDRQHYRPLNPMTLWGLAWSGRRAPDDVDLGGSAGSGRPDPYSSSQEEDESGQRRGESDSSEGGEQSAGDDSATDDADVSGEIAEGGESTSERPSATREEVSAAENDARRDQRKPTADRPPPGGIPYPEWDEYAHRVREHGATVSISVAEAGDGAWADDVLREHAPLVREVRDRFAPLRAHRQRLRRQRTGDELDLAACVDALVDRRMGRVPSERLYQVVRPSRHTVAIALLVDASGSTATRLADGRTVLDVERMTLLLASEALATLGDPFAMLAFSGAGRHGVRVRTIKSFDEHDAAAPRRRISALAPEDNTRLGAAVRHATAVLRAQPAQRRVLLMLSDGQPNDVDFYQGSYAIEDSRRALNEARAEGVVPFCLTVEQEEREYLPHLFGRTGYRVLRRPEQLPAALLEVVKGILGGA
jgi:nitric oxide reductase NorD protein